MGGEVYNRGISGHHLIKVAKYLEANLADKTPRYVVIETGAVSFTHEDIDSLFNGTVEFSSSHDTGLLYFMQKIPYLRLLASQISGGLLDLFLGSSVQATITSSSEAPKADQTDYDRLIQFIAAACIKYGAEPIIFYHPTATLLENGEIEFDIDREALGLFSTSCQKNGITFINMEEAFLDMWNEDHAVPHGFVTGSSHTGHLNRFGHSKIAEQLASTIITLEEDK